MILLVTVENRTEVEKRGDPAEEEACGVVRCRWDVQQCFCCVGLRSSLLCLLHVQVTHRFFNASPV